MRPLVVAFGLDSVIELLSGGILLWRLSVEARGSGAQLAEKAERRAARIVAATLALLCLYVRASAVYGLVTQAKPDASPVGIVVSAAAVLFMPYLGLTKRRLAALFHWWWAEDLVALVFLIWLVGETREAFEDAREGRQGHEREVY